MLNVLGSFELTVGVAESSLTRVENGVKTQNGCGGRKDWSGRPLLKMKLPRESFRDERVFYLT